MLTPEDDQLLSRFYAAAKTGDAAALRAILTNDVVVVWNGNPETIPWAGRFAGVEAAAQFFQTFQKHVEVVSATPVETLAAAGAVITTVEGRWRIRDTDTVFATRSCNIIRLSDGRVSGYAVYNDTAPFADNLAAART